MMIYLSNMVIFHGYVKYPDGKLWVNGGFNENNMEVHVSERFAQRKIAIHVFSIKRL